MAGDWESKKKIFLQNVNQMFFQYLQIEKKIKKQILPK